MSDASAIAAEPGVFEHPPRGVVRSRHRDRDYALRRALLVADMVGLLLALALALTVSGNRSDPLGDALWILPTLPFWALLFWSYRLYGRSIRSFEPTHLADTPSLFHALVLGTLGLWVFYRFIAPTAKLDLEEVLVFAALALPLIAMLRAALCAYNARAQGPERVFAVAPEEDVALLCRKLANHPELAMSVVGSVTQEACERYELPIYRQGEDVDSLIASEEIDHLIVRLDAAYLPQERALELMRACNRAGIRFSCFPAERGLMPPGVEVNHLEGMGMLSCNPPVLSRSAATLKRAADVVVSALALAVLSPLLALIAAAVRLDSRGPSLYRQIRVGKDGRRFELLKFRTMTVGADQLDDELMAHSIDPHWLVMKEDPRVTRVGRFLRRSSLDELPQLWNVLRADMSLVGPRPLSLRDDAKVQGWRRHRLDLTPGVTGWWQVLGRNSIPFEEMLEVDYAYVASWSIWHDIRILLQTVPVVLRRRGAN